ncbi:uncharacterized protein zgc:113229 [Triplophysa dalaica]|uniref:uncharacterized protein zgc:113229 n=1 Tax=Triplophysa dalaica TaxID=1582913 RepID=UPI0024DFE177|nr:uncharacterized protein zgc:113229 [Triplophysa dalaica]
MAELNPVSSANVLLESMLQKLRLNTQSNNGSQTDIQTSSSPVEFNAVKGEDSSEVYQFGCPSTNSGDQDRRSSIWKNAGLRNEIPWSLQSFPVGGTSTPNSNSPFRKIRKHVFSPKPKRTPLWRGPNNFTPERDSDVFSWAGQDGTPRLEKYNHISVEGENRDVLDSGVPPLFETEPYQKPPDLLAQRVHTSTSVLETLEVRGQRGTWSWGVGADHGKTTKTSKKKWGEAKRWAKKVKEQWREKHRGTENEQGYDGETQEMKSNLSPLPGPIDVNNTSTELVYTSYVHNEPIHTALGEAGTRSPTFMSENLFTLRTSNLMEEIFSGTEWAPFLSVNNTTQDQSNYSPSINNQSGEEERTGKWTHTYMTNSHFGTTQEQMSIPDSSTQDMAIDQPVYRRHGISQIVTELTTNQLQTSDMCTNQLQSVDLSLNETHNGQQMNELSQFSHQPSNEYENSITSYSQPEVSDLSRVQSQDRKEGFIPLLDLSYHKPVDSSSTSTQGSLWRKREHWTKRREPSEDTGQDMEDENHRSSYMSTHSSNSTRSISPTSYLNSYQNSEDVESSFSMGTAVKKRRMDNSCHVRFAEEVVILPPTIWPEEEEENEEVMEKEEDWQEDTAPRSSFPKWIGSIKGFKRTKYKF